MFSMVSKEITRYVVDYINTLAWKNKMIIQSFHHSACHEQTSTIEHYRDLGKLNVYSKAYVALHSIYEEFITENLLICVSHVA